MVEKQENEATAFLATLTNPKAILRSVMFTLDEILTLEENLYAKRKKEYPVESLHNMYAKFINIMHIQKQDFLAEDITDYAKTCAIELRTAARQGLFHKPKYKRFCDLILFSTILRLCAIANFGGGCEKRINEIKEVIDEPTGTYEKPDATVYMTGTTEERKL